MLFYRLSGIGSSARWMPCVSRSVLVIEDCLRANGAALRAGRLPPFVLVCPD